MHKHGWRNTADGQTMRAEGLFDENCEGKADRSTGYDLGQDSFTAVVLACGRPPGFDLRKIQKQALKCPAPGGGVWS
jgi:hypothetical protein